MACKELFAFPTRVASVDFEEAAGPRVQMPQGDSPSLSLVESSCLRRGRRRAGGPPALALAISAVIGLAGTSCGGMDHVTREHVQRTFVVSATGQIGQLRIGVSSRADVRRAAGMPAFVGMSWSTSDPGLRHEALGYACSR